MKYYVVSDIHGYFGCLKKALDNAGFFDDKDTCKLIVCGDLLDRGQEARELIEFMIGLMKEDKLIYILGNHEELMVQCLQEISRGGVYEIASGMSHHYRNKTWHSLLQISGMSESEAYNNPLELVSRVINSPLYKELLTICVDYYETPNYIFTHGWIPCITDGDRYHPEYKYDPNWRQADVQSWRMARWFNGMELASEYNITEPGKTVVCGHWHTSYGHSKISRICSEWGEDAIFTPFRAEGILAIDGCTAHSSIVNCVVIED